MGPRGAWEFQVLSPSAARQPEALELISRLLAQIALHPETASERPSRLLQNPAGPTPFHKTPRTGPFAEKLLDAPSTVLAGQLHQHGPVYRLSIDLLGFQEPRVLKRFGGLGEKDQVHVRTVISTGFSGCAELDLGVSQVQYTPFWGAPLRGSCSIWCVQGYPFFGKFPYLARRGFQYGSENRFCRGACTPSSQRPPPVTPGWVPGLSALHTMTIWILLCRTGILASRLCDSITSRYHVASCHVVEYASTSFGQFRATGD